MQRPLVERATEGEVDAFDVLARMAGGRLMAIAYRIVRDVTVAEDAVQATLSAWRQLPSLRDPERFDAWLHRLLSNACYAELGRARRSRTDVRLRAARETASGRDEIVRVADRDQLERAFRRLPPRCRGRRDVRRRRRPARRVGRPLGTGSVRCWSAAPLQRTR